MTITVIHKLCGSKVKDGYCEVCDKNVPTDVIENGKPMINKEIIIITEEQ